MLNTLILLAAAEFVLYPFFDPATEVIFTRVGAVYPDSVKITTRYPDHNSTENSVRLVWREFKEATATDVGWKDGPVFSLTEDDDWVGTVTLSSLWPSTAYECKHGLSDNSNA